MLKNEIRIGKKVIPYLENESESKKVLIFFHGLDGTASSAKPIFRAFADIKVVAVEQRGHNNSPIPASRFIGKHLQDYRDVINHFAKQGYEIYLLGESMGASYVTLLAFEELPVKYIFAQSIPNKLVNVMDGSAWEQFKVQFMTTISFFTNINYKYSASINYTTLSNSKVLHRIANFENKTKIRQVRETLATWAANKRAFNWVRRKKIKNNYIYFQPGNDVISDAAKSKKVFNKKNADRIMVIPDAKHILMWEPNAAVAFDHIQSIIRK